MSTLQERFIAAAKLLSGVTPPASDADAVRDEKLGRWQAAAAAKIGISRSHMHHVLTGFRAVTQAVTVKMIDAARAEAIALRKRADQLDEVLALMMPDPNNIALPPATDDDPEGHAALDELLADHFDERKP